MNGPRKTRKDAKITDRFRPETSGSSVSFFVLFESFVDQKSAGAKVRRTRWMQAFTLVEVLAALAFLGILMPVVLSALLVANRAGLVAERSGSAVELAENRLNELMLANAWNSAASRGDFGADWSGYRWELGKKDWPTGEGLTELTLTVFFPIQGQEQQVQLTTLAAETTP